MEESWLPLICQCFNSHKHGFKCSLYICLEFACFWLNFTFSADEKSHQFHSIPSLMQTKWVMSQCQTSHEQIIARAFPVTVCLPQDPEKQRDRRVLKGQFTLEETSDIEPLCNTVSVRTVERNVSHTGILTQFWGKNPSAERIVAFQIA